MVGRRDDTASAAALEDLDKKEVHECLCALEKVIPGPEPLQKPEPKSSFIETMARAVVGSNHHNGIIQSKSTPHSGAATTRISGNMQDVIKEHHTVSDAERKKLAHGTDALAADGYLATSKQTSKRIRSGAAPQSVSGSFRERK